MSQTKTNLKDIYAPIISDLKDFERFYAQKLETQDALIGSIHRHLLLMGGKFLRPALTLLCSKLTQQGQNSAPKAIELATAVELIHTATLVHDDIIDESDFRRNQPSIYSKWGREISIVSGDYLYAKAFMALAGLKDIWLNEAFSTCAAVMCEGEMKQIEKRSDFTMGQEAYFKIIYKKTAALFQASCMGGAYFSQLPVNQIKLMGDYGHYLGMAFQIVDDCLDMTGQTDVLGKPAGLDFLKNDVTLPVIYLFEEFNSSQQNELIELIKNKPVEAATKIRSMMTSGSYIERSFDKARFYSQEALKCVSGLEASDYKDSLTMLCSYCLEREK